MTFKELVSELKQELKDLAISIRSLKNERGPSNSGYVSGLESEQWTYRTKHIAYCLLRGRDFLEVEQSWRDPELGLRAKTAGEKLLESYKESIDEAVQGEQDEIVCPCT